MKLTENFKLAEFHCKSGQKVPDKYLLNVKALAANLQVIRKHVKKPIYITSGYRDTAYNKKVGGVARSQHLTASAADIQIKGMEPQQVYNIILDLMLGGFITKGGLGLYKTFVHYDIRGYIIPFKGSY